MNNISSTQEASVKKQKYLGDKGFVVFIAFLGAFIPLSTDIYLPALPRMVDNLNTTAGMVNLTLVFFFIFYAVGTLFWGPLSDKYGRKPVLLIGLCIYTVASILCIFATNVYALIFFRTLQAIGCGSATAVSTAVIKDLYSGKKRVKILAIVQSMGTISPIIAPVIGAFILNAISWRGIFVVLSGFGLSEKVYSYFFAANAIFFLIGPTSFIHISKYFHYKKIIPAAYIIISISGLLMLSIGILKPWIFFLSMLPISLCGSLMGPPRANLMLEQLQGDTGAASSLMSCGFTLFGCIGMLIISSSSLNKVFLLGFMYFIIGIITLTAWFLLSNKSFIKHIYYHTEQVED